MKPLFHTFITSTLLALLWTAASGSSAAQQVDFSTYSDYGIQLFTDQDLVFGENGRVITGEGTVEIPISSGKKTTIAIEGVKYLDVTVEILGSQYLYKNGNTSSDQRIPFDLKAAYTNVGNNNYSQARIIPVAGDNSATTRFRIRGRGKGPPQPPPVPPHEGFSPPMGQAYLYLYGSIDVGSVDAGSYYSSVEIYVSYAQNN